MFLANSLWLLLSSSLSYAGEADINCLKSIKSQLQDSNGFLSNWVFNNKTSMCLFTGVSCWDPGDLDKVLKIELSGYGLRGEFPRGIKECKSLLNLDLSRNNLSGTLPSDISTLIENAISLDLSFNSFSGEIPADLASCSYLNTLILENNQFMGQSPPQLSSLGRLKQFSVANNLLTGPVPNFYDASITPRSYDNNRGLCGAPLDPCQAPPEGIFLMIITGATVGAVTFAPIGAGIGWFCFSRKEQQRQRRTRSKNRQT